MELLTVNSNQSNGAISMDEASLNPQPELLSTDKPFIQANTEETSLQIIKESHIIPVFIKDNEPLISHADFIETAMQVVSEVYDGETILKPSIRVSHPIKGRTPEAKNKPANELQEWEKTLFFERMAFIIEVPTISDTVRDNTLSLTIGGVKAYNMDNLYSKKGADQHFKIFIGYKNKVCTNLCVWSDGLMNDLKVSGIGQLMGCIRTLLENYNAVFHLNSLRMLNDYALTESQFAHVIGRCRMYNSLPADLKKDIPPLHFGDNQIGAVVKDYYKDESFCRDADGNINLWKLYNLLTGVNKSSYIDNFIEKSANAFNFSEQIRYALENKSQSWFLN
jgi:hypothetical protein